MTTAKKTPAKKAAKRAKPAATPTGKLHTEAEPAPALTNLLGEVVVPPVHPEKQKLVRDSFTMPKREYEQLGALKSRLMKLEHAIKKGELLRAGVAALTAMSNGELLTAVDRIERLKTGRPEKKGTSGKPAKKKT